MKYQVVVKDSQGNTLHEPTFKTLKDAEEHKLLCEDFKNYPKFPLKKVITKAEVSHVVPAVDEVVEIVPEVPAVLDESGVEITPAIPGYIKVISGAIPEYTIIDSPEESYMVPDYVVTIEDKTADEEAEVSKKQAKEQKRLDRVSALQALDWSTIDSFAKVKPVCKLMSEIINDILKDQ
jgi:hypothetical protein